MPSRGAETGHFRSTLALERSLRLGAGVWRWGQRAGHWLISILSISRTVLLWFGPQDTMQTTPQPCKAREGLRWMRLPGLGQARCGWGGGRRGGGTGRNGLSGPLFPPPRGFCFFNSVAIACRQLQQQGKASRILIVDWVGPGTPSGPALWEEP